MRDVRIADGATDTLLSVRQLWIQQNWDCRFGKHNSILIAPSDDEYPFTFCNVTGLYDWHVALGGPDWSGLPSTSLNTRPASKPVAAFIVLTHHLTYTTSALPTLQL